MGVKLRFERPFVRDNTNRVVANESELVQQANLIATKVSQTDFNGNTISSLINQTATTIKIQAEKIQLEGIVTANNNFKVLLDGSIEAVNAKLSGSITATKMVSPSGTDYYGEIGVTSGLAGFGLFDLRYNTEAFFEVISTVNGNGFSLRDKNNYTRFQAGPDSTVIRDNNNIARFSTASDRTSLRGPSGYEGILLGATNGYLQSPNNRTFIYVSDNEAGVVVNGVVKVRWN